MARAPKKSLLERIFPSCERCGRRRGACPGHTRDENSTLGLPGRGGRARQPTIKIRDTGKRWGR